jgi:hypothetical protein
VTLETGRGRHSKYIPHAFTEHGIAMLSSVLRSPRAVQMNILVVRAFVRMRELIAANKDFATRIEKLERGHNRTASVIEVLVEDIDRHRPAGPRSKANEDAPALVQTPNRISVGQRKMRDVAEW